MVPDVSGQPTGTMFNDQAVQDSWRWAVRKRQWLTTNHRCVTSQKSDRPHLQCSGSLRSLKWRRCYWDVIKARVLHRRSAPAKMQHYYSLCCKPERKDPVGLHWVRIARHMASLILRLCWQAIFEKCCVHIYFVTKLILCCLYNRRHY